MILALLLLALVVFVVGGPIRAARGRAGGLRGRGRRGGHGRGAGRNAGRFRAGRRCARELDELETARETKYREILDAELDYRTGKLSREDYEAIDADLRAEAIEILDRLERLQAQQADDGENAGADAAGG